MMTSVVSVIFLVAVLFASTQVHTWPVSAKLQDIIERSNKMPVSNRLRTVIQDADKEHMAKMRARQQQQQQQQAGNGTTTGGGSSMDDSDSNSSEEDFITAATTESSNTTVSAIPVNRKPADINAGVAGEGKLPKAAKEKRGRQISGLLAISTLGLVAGVAAITVVAFQSKK